MEKVMCVKCGSIGYTASPETVRCSECGGKHKVIPYNPALYIGKEGAVPMNLWMRSRILLIERSRYVGPDKGLGHSLCI